ncbi:MAG: 16S rRNA (cytosine(967)-C(5))-methyltransferase RsmB [Candidatus Kapabacteria bacterium]|nr:16S rRNA (cytosine(967)-C(5))-methyltransferase RsmB [Candidatus Kapabacteria bacterium]
MTDQQAPSAAVRDELAAPRIEESSTAVFQTARGTAVKLLTRYENSDSYIDKLLDGELRRSELEPADRALVTELVNGTVRWQSRLDWVLTGFYHGEFAKCMPLVKNSMRIALYQMLFLSKIPAPAAINESVELVKRIKGDKHAGVVNGVLRNILRNVHTIRYPDRQENEVLHLSIHYAHPQWIVRRYVDRFGGEQAEALLAANNHRPMLTLRVNTMRSTIEEIERLLTDAEIKYEVSPVHASSIMITSLRDVRALPLFQDGLVTVQDASASLAVQLAAPRPGMLVVDLCAAPGGKAVHAAEIMKNDGTVIAIEKYESKLRLIDENASRSGISIVKSSQGDAREYSSNDLADLVLVDAPCTGMGTLSKKPDIKWRREIDDIRKMSLMQREILDHASTLVKVGGAIIYSTCTIEPEENSSVVSWFLDKHPEFMLQRAEELLPSDVCEDGFLQTFQHRHKSDGAFGARLVRVS